MENVEREMGNEERRTVNVECEKENGRREMWNGK